MAQITLNSSGVASNGTLALQSNGTTTAVTIDASQNVGVGVTPSAWNSDYKPLQIGITSCVYGRVATNEAGLSQNLFRDTSSNYKYIGNGYAAVYAQLSGGGHAWFTAPSNSSGAGAALTLTQAMTLDASGNVGIGTSSPNGKLQVLTGSAPNIAEIIIGYNGTSVNYIDANTNIFRNGSANEVMRIDGSGNLLVGKTSAANNIVGAEARPTGEFFATSAATTNAALTTWNTFSTGASAYRFYVGFGGTVFATSTTISAISDIRYKENIRDLDVGLDKIMALKPRLYDWKEGKGADIKNARGFIAQEFEQVFPDLIDEWADPAPEGEEPYKSVRQDLIPVLVKAIQEQQAIITQLQADVAALKGTA